MSEFRRTVDGEIPSLWANVRTWGYLLFKAWTTPQRLCGCRPKRR